MTARPGCGRSAGRAPMWSCRCHDALYGRVHLRRRLRREAPGVPVLFLSARSAAEDVVQGFETGGNDYLRKPFAMSELIVRVRALAGRAGVGKARTERVFELGRMRFDADASGSRATAW